MLVTINFSQGTMQTQLGLSTKSTVFVAATARWKKTVGKGAPTLSLAPGVTHAHTCTRNTPYI
jgi:hypothetical protein